MKKISVVIPCYNEEENVRPMGDTIRQIFKEQLPAYDYEILFIDNKSQDRTRAILREMCARDHHIKAIFNMKNFGQFNSPFYGLCQSDGDCTITLCADFQEPPENIPAMVRQWEQGHKVVAMIKTRSRESRIKYRIRSLYYKMIRRMSNTPQIDHFTGYGLYDRSFIEIMRSLKDPTPFLRGIVAEYATDIVKIPYEQQERRAGKTKNNFFTLFDAAMLSFTSYTKGGLRLATFGGLICSALSFAIAIFYLIMKLIYWDRFIAGNAPVLIGMFFLGGVQLTFIGLLGEYIMSMNSRIINRPLVIEEERLNFDCEESKKDLEK